MKHRLLIFPLLALCLLLSGCTGPSAQPSQPEHTTSPAPVSGGWAEREGKTLYLDENGIPLTGWQVIGEDTYCFLPDGTMLTGWVNDNGRRSYLGIDGKMVTGWQSIGTKRFHFREDGAMDTGWTELEGKTYFFGVDGSLITGLMNIEGKGYYFDTAGARYSGWLTLGEYTYYFDEQGVMAVGPTQIDGKTWYFSPKGVQIYLVNPWNPVPEGYATDLESITDIDRMSVDCAEALRQMIADCEAAGNRLMIASAYRTQEEQEYLFERKVKFYTKQNWSREAAEKEAAKNVAVPGTSEHQLGLAVDLMDLDYPYLDDHQADTPAQQWLMEHCWEYGFILRYPVGTTEITGIIYEPWHYRYVGVEIAREITEKGITLEEYLGTV